MSRAKQFLTRQQLFDTLLEMEKKYRIAPKQFLTMAQCAKEDAITIVKARMEYLDGIAKELGFIK